MAQEFHRQTEISSCVASEVETMNDMIDGKALETSLQYIV